MANKDCFSSFHPLVNFTFFLLVIVFSMFFMHPASLLISALSAMAYFTYLRGRKGLGFCLRFILPMMFMAMLVNPAFNHRGVTVLCYLPSDNPLTLESIAYGVAAAMMLSGIFLWFGCYSDVMTSDKFIYLFGRVIPALSLVLSMTLRFVPKFIAQLRVVSEAQRCIGRRVSDGGLMKRGRNAVTVFSIMITWSLENAIETADSMRSRGYGLPGRTAFSIYRFTERDRLALGWLGLCGLYIVCGWAAGGFEFNYYPMISAVGFGAYPLSFQMAYLALCLTPLIINLKEDRKWNVLKSET